ncbi:hypothetical protein GZH47_33050 (plasmid) [Paenibacillus rhizovicinus]|uniref:Uncharacterized protein n=1 Tax=Paenibacillus rhizovicinus TaxID=2704463 RepID=A0A6C0PCJ5_9BACL|nr:hypothetical protein [Paenibacillus rhizovicinus]QHW35723.1 hypothetical protein GZH47_33050 [Paenibacillus rhizovicinus]
MAQTGKKPLHMIQKYAAARREVFYKRQMMQHIGFVYVDSEKAWLHPGGARFSKKLFDLFDFNKTKSKLLQLGFISPDTNPNTPYQEENDDELE